MRSEARNAGEHVEKVTHTHITRNTFTQYKSTQGHCVSLFCQESRSVWQVWLSEIQLLHAHETEIWMVEHKCETYDLLKHYSLLQIICPVSLKPDDGVSFCFHPSVYYFKSETLVPVSLNLCLLKLGAITFTTKNSTLQLILDYVDIFSSSFASHSFWMSKMNTHYLQFKSFNSLLQISFSVSQQIYIF